MKTFFYFLPLFVLTFSANAQVNGPVAMGFEESLTSKILGEQRKVWIHIPNSNGGNKVTTTERYPVIYLLDGGENFNSVVSITEHMSQSGLCPPMIVVGILHPNRLVDLTIGTDEELPGIVGRGEKFMAYVEKELVPHINSNYPTTSYKVFIGHSLGGLIVTHTFLHKPDLFNSYVSLDGSLWWDNQKSVKESKTILPVRNYKSKALFIGLANRMEKGVDTLSVQKDTSGTTQLLRSNLEFIKELSKNRKNQLRFKHAFYENDDHNSVRLIGEYDALRFIFDFYKLKIYESELDNPDFKLEEVIVSHFRKVSEQMGYSVNPGESLINSLGYKALGNKQFAKAEALFQLNIANYPESANCYDSMGDFYLAKEDKLKAIASFKKALTLKEVSETREKLEKLLKEKKV
ncbi:MAG TPA: alpha/beta hydrolase-fold protein [Flavobacterium sp.]|nr:alpha/beta hydrolase-fold protein [Flavobacterium sp.]